MESQRNFFIISFIFITFIIFQTWYEEKYLTINKDDKKIYNTEFNKIKKDININNTNQIIIETDVLKIKINKYSGNIEQASLLKYPETLYSKNKFNLLKSLPDFSYNIKNGFIKINNNTDIKLNQKFYSKKNIYKMLDNQKEIQVPMTYFDENGILYTKTFILHKNSYSLIVDYKIKNMTKNTIKFKVFGELQQTPNIPKKYEESNNNFAINAFRGAAYSTEKIKYKKHKFQNIIDNKQINIFTEQGWISMIQQYFVTAWIPIDKKNIFYTKYLDKDNLVTIGYESLEFKISPYNQKNISSILWIGPKIQSDMSNISKNLDLTVDYGFLWFIAQPLFKLLKYIHKYINNWGFSIIVITFIIRLLMYPLTKAQYSSAAKMKFLQPKIQALNEKYQEDKNKLSREMLKLYKKEKVNPLGGCLPLLIQMPIFLALYAMLVGSVELRHAPFILWIHDLSSQDPYYVLPCLMCITMFVIQKMSPNTITDKTQKKIMDYMPIVFTLFFLWCPSGLVLYYIVSNLLTIMQQKIIFHSLKK